MVLNGLKQLLDYDGSMYLCIYSTSLTHWSDSPKTRFFRDHYPLRTVCLSIEDLLELLDIPQLLTSETKNWKAINLLIVLNICTATYGTTGVPNILCVITFKGQSHRILHFILGSLKLTRRPMRLLIVFNFFIL